MRNQVIAVDLGGTNTRVALLQKNKIIKLIKNKTSKYKNEILNNLCYLINELITKEVKGIGIGSPGPLRKGVILNPPNLPFRNFNLESFIEKKFRTRVEIENDANCVALAELHYGYGKGRKNFFVLTLGTGIGGGIIIDGKLYSRNGIGGELGYIYLDKKKSFEELVGGRAIQKMIKKEYGKDILFSELFLLNDRKASFIINYTAEILGQGIGSLINIFCPEVVVLTGGMMNAGDNFLKLIREDTKKYILFPGNFSIVRSKLKEAGILGAGLLIQ